MGTRPDWNLGVCLPSLPLEACRRMSETHRASLPLTEIVDLPVGIPYRLDRPMPKQDIDPVGDLPYE